MYVHAREGNHARATTRRGRSGARLDAIHQLDILRVRVGDPVLEGIVVHRGQIPCRNTQAALALRIRDVLPMRLVR